MKEKKFKRLVSAFIGLILTVGLIQTTGFATTSLPTLTSATYDVGTGELVLTGTNFVATNGSTNDIDPKKIRFTNGVSHVYTLSPSTKKVEITDDKSAKIDVCDKDKAVLAGWLDKAGTTDAAGNSYSLMVLAGWDGSTSKTNVSAHGVSVSGIAKITSATYDVNTKKLVITGSGLCTASLATTKDIFPTYLTISDGASNSYTLNSTNSVKIDSASQATITLSDKDAAAINTWINRNGTTTDDNNSYSLSAEAGWNGVASMSDLAENVITVSNYAAPTVTVSDNASVTVGSATSSVATDKIGFIYLVPSTIDITNETVDYLNALVTNKIAVKVSVTALRTAPSISTKGLVIGTDTCTYKAVAVDTAGTISALSSKSITVNNVSAPALTVTAVKGSIDGSTTLTVIPASGNSIYYKVSSSGIGRNNTPKVGLTPSGTTKFTTKDNITTADATTNKYLEVYELDGSGMVVKFKEITLTTASFRPDATAPVLDSTSPTAIDSSKKTITLTFNENIAKATTTDALLKSGVNISTDGSTFTSLGSSDTVSISGKTMIIIFNSALTTATNKIKIATNTIKDSSGNKNSGDITTAAIDATK